MSEQNKLLVVENLHTSFFTDAGVQVFHYEQFVLFAHVHYLLSVGSNASRSPSPSRLKDSAIRPIVIAGNTSLKG